MAKSKGLDTNSWFLGVMFFAVLEIGNIATYFFNKYHFETSGDHLRGLLFSSVVAIVGGVVGGLFHYALRKWDRTNQ